MIQVNLQPEYVLSFLGIMVTNTLLTAISVTLLLSILGVIFFIFRRKNENKHFFLKLLHITVFELLSLTDTITQDRALSRRLMPLVATLFLFILCTNLIALLPGFLGSFYVETIDGPVSLFRSPNSDLTTTLALAIVTVLAIQYFSIKLLGAKGYLRRFINFSGVIPFILGIFEGLSEAMRLLSFSFRLFGNIFAGEVLLLVIAFLVPYVLPVPFMLLEIFISLIQAYIFCVLALTYVRLSTTRSLQGG